jgi:LTXXQ motif family protein
MKHSLFVFTAVALISGTALTSSASARDRYHDSSRNTDLSANQTSDQNDARTARIRADLRLTPDQENNWSGFESAMRDYNKKRSDREVALRADGAQQKGPADIIEQMRRGADTMTERSADQKKLADAAQPLFASLNDQQKRRFTETLIRIRNEPDAN